MVVCVPDDIWRNIALFMSHEDLRRLIGVNSVLFHLGMDAKYQSVSFEDFNDLAVARFQRHSDPSIAPRIRHLHVCPAHTQGYVVPGGEGKESKYNTSLEDVVQMLAETFSVLSQVASFSVDWPPHKFPDEPLLPLLTTAWKTFGSGLRKLVAKVDLIHPLVLLSTAGMLVVLQELELEISGEGDLNNPHPEDMNSALVTMVPPFLNDVAPTLRSLSLTSYTWYLDYSLLFNLMEQIPNLESLTVRMEMSMCRLSDPRGLTRILRDHARTLRHVKWSSYYPGDLAPAGNLFIKWMEVNQLDRFVLSNLLTLELTIPSSSMGFKLAILYIRRSVDTLTSLSLSGSHLTHDEVTLLLSEFTHRREERRLEVLHLQVTFLSLEFVLMLAKTLPFLHTLILGIRSVGGDPNEWTDRKIEAEKAQQFVEELKLGNFQSWHLYDIGIAPSTSLVSDMLMHAFAECVPSIRRFFGEDRQ